MRVLQSTVVVGFLAAVIVACSSGPGATPSGSDGSGGGNTGGGGTGGDTGVGNGQIHIDIGGPVPATVDLPFLSIGSRFSGEEAGVNLNFTAEDTGIATITGVVDGEFVIGYVGEELGANVQTCDLTGWTIGATSASGSFDCRDGFGTAPDGTYLTGVTMRGSFEASQ